MVREFTDLAYSATGAVSGAWSGWRADEPELILNVF
jgi:hypothetical protein